MKPSRLLILFFVFALSGAGGLIYYHYQMPDIDFIGRDVNERLLKIDSLDSSISELALRSRTNLDSNYDMLVRSVNLVSEAVQELDVTYFNDPAVREDLLGKRFVSLKNALETKKDLVENFKSHNSVLRNSEKYAPLVGRKLVAIAEEQGLTEIAKFYSRIVVAVLEFANQPRGANTAELNGMVSKIPATEPKMPEEHLSLIIEFANHVSTVIEEKELTDVYLSRALSTISGNQIDELTKAWSSHLTGFYKLREQFFMAILLYILVLLIFTGYIGLRLRDLYVSLDGEVALRTEEVKKAYNELSQSEKQLMQTEKMASLGQLVAGVAHEINTPLGYITCNLDTVRENMEDFKVMLEASRLMSKIISQKPLDKNSLGVVIKRNVIAYNEIRKRGTVSGIEELLADSTYGLNEIAQLVSSLKDFSRLDSSNTVNANIHDGLEATIKICGNLIGERKLIKTFDPNLPEMECIPAQINQVFMNLIANAAQATDASDGIIEIKTQSDGENLFVFVTDNGVGMDEETMSRMFDPFFTTREVDEGTGLGLSIAYKIIKSHGGSASVNSTLGKGTRITLQFPVSQNIQSQA